MRIDEGISKRQMQMKEEEDEKEDAARGVADP